MKKNMMILATLLTLLVSISAFAGGGLPEEPPVVGPPSMNDIVDALLRETKQLDIQFYRSDIEVDPDVFWRQPDYRFSVSVDADGGYDARFPGIILGVYEVIVMARNGNRDTVLMGESIINVGEGKNLLEVTLYPEDFYHVRFTMPDLPVKVDQSTPMYVEFGGNTYWCWVEPANDGSGEWVFNVWLPIQFFDATLVILDDDGKPIELAWMPINVLTIINGDTKLPFQPPPNRGEVEVLISVPIFIDPIPEPVPAL